MTKYLNTQRQTEILNSAVIILSFVSTLQNLLKCALFIEHQTLKHAKSEVNSFNIYWQNYEFD